MDGKHLFTWSMKSKNSEILQEHEYYGPLIDQYTESILKSGLLLDEDLEVLLTISTFRSLPTNKRLTPSFNLLASCLSALCCSLLAKRYRMPLLVVPPAVIASYFIVTELKEIRKRKNDREIVEKLIDIINRNRNLNLSIIRYLKTRADLENNKNAFLNLYNKSIRDFIDLLLKEENTFFRYVTNTLKTISSYSSDLSDDYKCLMHLNPISILESNNIDNIENCLVLTRKIQDLHVLFASKLLSYIGIVCCSKSSRLRDRELDALLNKTLYNTEKYFQQHHDIVKKQFVACRRSMNRKSEYKMHTAAKTSKNRQIQTKLRETLVCSVNNLSVILEKSQGMLDATESADDMNINEVSRAILDLKNHTFATYEALDVLCRLYGVLTNPNVRKSDDNKITLVNKKNGLEETRAVINYDDDTEPLEEKFELYVGNEDIDQENTSVRYDTDRSEEYLTLMLRELRQSLKQHQRFIDAKNRRGSDDDDTKKDQSVELRKSPPKFDLAALNSSPSQASVETLDLGKEENSAIGEMPAPPPPPLPAFHLDNLEEESGRVNARSMLDNIKALSSQRNIEEEVFGD